MAGMVMRKVLALAVVAIASSYLLSTITFVSGGVHVPKTVTPRSGLASENIYQSLEQDTFANTETATAAPWTSLLAVAAAAGLVMGFMLAPAHAEEPATRSDVAWTLAPSNPVKAQRGETRRAEKLKAMKEAEKAGAPAAATASPAAAAPAAPAASNPGYASSADSGIVNPMFIAPIVAIGGLAVGGAFLLKPNKQ